MNKTLFFDLDETKFKTLPAQVAYLNSTYKLNVSESEYLANKCKLDLILKTHRPDLTLSFDEIYRNYSRDFLESHDRHKDILPMEGMPRILPLLAKKYTIVDVTARQKSGLLVIQHLLRKYVPGCVSYIHCAWEYQEGKGYVNVSKKDFIMNFPGEKIAFFDDTLHEIEDTKDIIPSYLFGPTNLHLNAERINRAESWEHIGDMFL